MPSRLFDKKWSLYYFILHLIEWGWVIPRLNSGGPRVDHRANRIGMSHFLMHAIRTVYSIKNGFCFVVCCLYEMRRGSYLTLVCTRETQEEGAKRGTKRKTLPEKNKQNE